MSEIFTVHDTPEENPDLSIPDPHQDSYSKTYLGFWTYLMTDCVLFASLFITHAVLQTHTFHGPSGKDLFSLTNAYAETMILLLSSASCGMAVLSSIKNKKNHTLTWLMITIVLGGSFLFLELNEFAEMINALHSWKQSAFLSSFFTLVGTHGLHITTGLLWAAVMVGQLIQYGITIDTFRRLVIFSLFWHFLDLIWIFIFTLVYLMGVI